MTISETISFSQFFSIDEMREFVDGFYHCPTCGGISEGWFVNQEEDKPDEFGLMCRHRFQSRDYLPSFSVHHKENLTMYLSFDVRTKEGDLRQRLFQRSESFVINFLMLLYGDSANLATVGTQGKRLAANDITTTTTAAANTTTVATILRRNAAAADVTQGCAVGTSTTAATATDGALTTPILNGAVANKLSYGGESFTEPAAVGLVVSFTDARVFTNNSGGNITINEAGLFQVATVGFANAAMLTHDITPSGVIVLNTNSVTGTYTISTTT